MAFEQGLGRRSLSRRRLIVAAAAAVLVVALIPFALRSQDRLAEARSMLAAGRPQDAVALLESADPGTSGRASLLALARFAAGDEDPARGLVLAAAESDFLPCTEAELAARDPGPVRVDGENGPSVELPRGLVLDPRPELVVRPGAQPMTLRLFRNDDQAVLHSAVVSAGDPATVVRFAIPAELGDLAAERRHGVEVRDAEGRLVAYADFVVAAPAVRDSVGGRAQLLCRLIADPARRAAALGNLYLRRFLYADAVASFERVPELERDALLRRALDIARRQLWGR